MPIHHLANESSATCSRREAPGEIENFLRKPVPLITASAAARARSTSPPMPLSASTKRARAQARRRGSSKCSTPALKPSKRLRTDPRLHFPPTDNTIELVLRILVAKGLPLDIALYIVHHHKAVRAPSAQALLTDLRLATFADLCTSGRAPKLQGGVTRFCVCDLLRTNTLPGHGHQRTEQASQWCSRNHQSVYLCLHNLPREPITPTVAAHSTTNYSWRAMENGHLAWLQRVSTCGWPPNYWEARRHHNTRIPASHATKCATTALYYTMVATKHGLTHLPNHPPNREYSLARHLKTASMRELAYMLKNKHSNTNGIRKHRSRGVANRPSLVRLLMADD